MASERLVVYVILAVVVTWLMFGSTRWAIWQARRTLSCPRVRRFAPTLGFGV